MFVCSVYMPVCIHTKLDYKRMLSQLVNIRVYRVYPCVLNMDIQTGNPYAAWLWSFINPCVVVCMGFSQIHTA